MKCWSVERFGTENFGNLSLVERPDPVPGPRDIIVRMRAASLNYRDLLVVDGRYGLDPDKRAGMVPLSDGAGEVVAVGAQVRRVRVGDRVAPIFHQSWLAGEIFGTDPDDDLGGRRDGVLADQMLVPEEGVVLLPDAVDYEEAATLPCAAVTAWSALMAGRPARAGETLLVQGSGGVSVFALQLGKALGLRVIATTSSDLKAERLRALGADEVINYVADPQWSGAVRALTGGRGVDRVVEIGGPGTFMQSILAMSRSGQIAAVGMLGGVDGAINPIYLVPGTLSIHGIAVGSRAGFEQLISAIVANRIRPVIDSVFAFEDAREAYRHLEAQRHLGKVVIRIS